MDPLPFPTPSPTIAPTLNKDPSNNPYMAAGLSIFLISIVAAIITGIQYSKYKFLPYVGNELHIRPFWISLLATLFLYGIVLMSVEGTATSLDDLKIARSRVQIAFCIFFFIVVVLFSNAYYFKKDHNISVDFFVYSACIAGLLTCLILVGNACNDLSYLENPQFLSGSIVTMLLGSAILSTTLWVYYYGSGDMNIIAASIGGLATLIGFILTCVAASQTLPPPVGEPMPFTNIPAYPKDLYCQNITNTITPATWSKVSRLRWKFTPAYLPNINGTLGPMDLISVKDSTNTQVILVRYADKKLFFKISGISNELSLDVSSTMFASIAFITYEDVSGKKLGSVVVFDEYNNTNMQSLQISVDPATWGSTTIETFKNKSNNNADVISGMQLCTEIVPNSFENAPLIYKICFYGVLLLISYLVITRVLNMARGKF